MPAALHPYLNFDGNAREAFEFYGEALGATPQFATFGEFQAVPEGDLRALLEAERTRTHERIEALRRDHAAILDGMALTSTDDEHDPEGQTTAVDRSRTEALLAGDEQHLVDLDAAEQRLEDGSYGICEVCGRPIPRARLEVRPTARTCVDHAS